MRHIKVNQSTQERSSAAGYPSYTQLQKMYDYSLEIICSIDAEGKFREVSPASYRILGYMPSELMGRFFIDFVIEADRPATRHATSLVESGVKITNFENRYYHKDGRIIPIIWSAHWDEGEKMMFCIAKDASDIIEKKNLEKRLDAERKQQHEQMHEMLARIADGF
ncbi:MAG TPA: PAS domain S-box protein, partial [Flavisolibacter sp.]|nr:PAS domain S-box protein [Flavisolibacter sp.]